MKKLLVCLLSVLMLVSLTIGASAATKKISATQHWDGVEIKEDIICSLEGTITSAAGSNVTVTHVEVTRLETDVFPSTEIINYSDDTITLIGPANDQETVLWANPRPADKLYGMPGHIIAGVVDEGGYRGWMSAVEIDLGQELANATELTVEFTAKISSPNTGFGWEKDLTDSYGFGLTDQNGGFGLFCGDAGEEVSFHQYIPHGINAQIKDQSNFPDDSKMTKKNLESAFIAGAAVKMVRSGDTVSVSVNGEKIADYECKGKNVLTFGVCSQKLEISNLKVNNAAFDLKEGSPDTSDSLGLAAATVAITAGCAALLITRRKKSSKA